VPNICENLSLKWLETTKGKLCNFFVVRKWVLRLCFPASSHTFMAAKLSLELHMYFRFLRSRLICYVNVHSCQHGIPLEILYTLERGICACAISLLFYVREVYFYVSIYLHNVTPSFEIWKAKTASSPH